MRETGRSRVAPAPVILRALALALGGLLTLPQPAPAYSVMAHEAIIDTAWDQDIRPLLRKRFPNATWKELREAHGYTYGGAIIQDMGYYPHGSHFFSDLTHYVRSGDFILALLRNSVDLNEYAFALGALAHYAADNDGHRIGTNRAVPVLYPKLGRKYGDVVTYEQDPLAHLKTEFGFDVLEVARERYAPDSYHDFIGFNVSKRLVEQAFRETYGLELKSVLADEDSAFESYRRGVSKQIPKATRIAWSLKKDEIQRDYPSMTRKKFLYNLSRASYEKNWGKKYQKPGFGEAFLAFVWKLLPKIGPLKVLEFRTPTPQTEQMFEASFNATLDRYRLLLSQVRQGAPDLPNDNFDTGESTPPGHYGLADKSYAQLLDRLAERHFADVPAEVRTDVLKYYGAEDAPYATKRDAKAWAKVQDELAQLKAVAATAAEPAVEETGAAAVPH
jgi:hypothetical protein